MGYVGRFAPSPTGTLHLGSLLAAVGSFLDARHVAGRWLIRIEDLDSARCHSEFEHAILTTLKEFQLLADAPTLRQSERLAHYDTALEQLRARGLLFYCDCSRRDRAAEEENHTHCIRDCRSVARDPNNAALRIDLTGLTAMRHLDRSLGEVFFDPQQHRDVILRRRDGVIAYQLAVVIDDAAQGITDVVRGADLLASTPWQLALHQSLGLTPPRYLHLPVLMEADGRKLAKSRRSITVDTAQAMTTLLRTLGWLKQPLPATPTDIRALLSAAATEWTPETFAGLSAIGLAD